MDFEQLDVASDEKFVFDISELQKIQDTFTRLTGLSSIIVTSNGIPLTKPSRKCNLCALIHTADNRTVNCVADSLETKQKLSCLSSGVWSVQQDILDHDKVVAKWLVGEGDGVYKNPEKISEYAEMFHLSKADLLTHLKQIHQLSDGQLNVVNDFMHTLLSALYQKYDLQEKLRQEEIRKFKMYSVYWRYEARFKELLANVNLGVSVYTSDFKHVYSNPKGIELLRLSNDDILGKTVQEINLKLYDESGNLLDLCEHPAFKVISSQKAISDQIYGYYVDGNLRWIKVNGNPVFSEYGDFIEAVFSYADITAEKSKIDSLVETMHLLEKSNQMALLGTYTANVKERKWYGSGLYFDVIGVDDRRVLDLDEIKNIIHPDFRAELYGAWRDAVLNRNAAFTQIYKIIKQNTGEERWVQDKCQLVDAGDSQSQIVVGALQDITHIKLAEEALLESEKKYRQIFENVLDIYFKVDLDDIILEVSPSVEYYSSRKREQLIGLDVSQFFINHEDIDKLKAYVAMKHRLNDYCVDAMSSDGRSLTVSISVALVFENGKPSYYEGFVRDVTDRKQMEEQLTASESKFRKYIKYAPHAIIVAESSGNIIEINPMVTEISGYATEELMGLQFDKLFDEFDALKEHAERLRRDGKALSEFEIKTKSGEKKYVVVNTVVLPSGNHLTFGVDITSRRKVESDLQKKQHYLEEAQIFTKTGDATINFLDGSWESSANLDRIIGVDSSFEKIMESWYQIIHPSCLNELKAYFRIQIIEKRLPVDITYRIIRYDNKQIRWVHAIGHLDFMPGTNRLKMLRFTLQDITERKLAEDTLQQSKEQLKEFASHLQTVREDEKVALAREIHDDLGQLLAALKIQLGLMKMKISGCHEEISRKKTLEDVDKVIDLTNRSLAVSRRIMTDLRSDAVRNLGFEEAAQMYVNNFREQFGIECKFISRVKKIDFSQNQTVALYRIMQESLSNVAKHAKASLVKITLENNDDFIFFEIRDNGCGFDLNAERRIDSYGLVGMRERATLFGGKVHIESEPGKGTAVRIEIPFK